MSIEIVVYGEPVAQGRPRFSTKGGFARAYDPAKSRDYKDYVKLAASQQMGDAEPFVGSVALGIRVYRQMPKSLSKRNVALAESGQIRPTTKPDIDNYVKGIKDALKGICWRDDSQIVAYVEPFGKYYSVKPRIEITVSEWEVSNETAQMP